MQLASVTRSESSFSVSSRRAARMWRALFSLCRPSSVGDLLRLSLRAHRRRPGGDRLPETTLPDDGHCLSDIGLPRGGTSHAVREPESRGFHQPRPAAILQSPGHSTAAPTLACDATDLVLPATPAHRLCRHTRRASKHRAIDGRTHSGTTCSNDTCPKRATERKRYTWLVR